MNDLALYTTEELVQELISRHTFAGIIIHSTKELKIPSEEEHNQWNLLYRNLTIEQTAFVLNEVTKTIIEEI